MKKYILKLYISTVLLINIIGSTYGQVLFPEIKPLFPLDISMSVSGCFGDLRTNALHAGLDFRTLGKTGFNVYAVDSGYISRIKIEAGGYGRAIYITHPNGWVSVYAHLEKIREDIGQYCINEQYKLMQYSVDLFPKKDSIKIKRGEIIGLSGNAGMSTGPHLHFEIRDEKTQLPVNIPHFFNFPINDSVPPIIEKLWIYPKNEQSVINNQISKLEVPVKKDSCNNYIITDTLPAWGDLFFGLELNDPGNQSYNKTGIFSIDLLKDTTFIFNQTLDKFAFSEVRYVNSIIDYEFFQTTYRRINKLFKQPNNKLNIYSKLINNGIVSINDSVNYNYTIKVKDGNYNETCLKFTLRGKKQVNETNKTDSITGDIKKIECKTDQTYINNNIQVIFPSNALYEDLLFNYNSLPQVSNLYSCIHQVHNKYTPIHQPITIRIKPNNLPDSLSSKAIIAQVVKNKPIWGGGSWKNGYVETSIRIFGDYAVAFDTLAPKITPEFKIKKSLNFTDVNQIEFKITDNLTGINNYQGFIDGQWVLFEYDAKSDLLSYIFDPERMKFGQSHTLQLLVTDNKNNCAEIKMIFYK